MDSVDREEMLRLAEDLVRIPSFKTEETDAARFLGDFLAQRGYEVELQEVEPGRFQTIATLKGSGGGKSLMLNGHIDIDPLAMGWKRDPWTPSIEGDLVFGAGIRNMKSGRVRHDRGRPRWCEGRESRCGATWCWPAW